jgi:hypothetical protein
MGQVNLLRLSSGIRMKWISIADKIPDKAFYWKDDASGQTGIGRFNENGQLEFLSSGGHKPWHFEDWNSITHWVYAKDTP